MMHPQSVLEAGMALRECAAAIRPAKACGELLAEFRPDADDYSGRLLRFAGVGQRDVYNIGAPITFGGEVLIAGRVEHRSNEIAEIVFFRSNGHVWTPRFRSPEFSHLQDPCVTLIGDELVLGGVKYPVTLASGEVIWQMEFFRGRSLETLRRFLVGPAKMKDIRFCQLADGRVGVFTRPQGGKGGRGKIGFTVADSLDAVTAQMIEDAPLLHGQFADGEWGGANEAHLLGDGRLGVLGHVASWDQRGGRHYYPMTFCLDPDTLSTTPIQIIARRNQFPEAPAKRRDLEDVVFSGGLVRHGDGEATLYAGLGDAAAGALVMPDPFASEDEEKKHRAA